MFIKYKGQTSNLLSDLSREMGNTVDLKLSETILKLYFQQILKGASVEERIQIVSNLPAYLKPFCSKDSESFGRELDLFKPSKFNFTMEKISKILAKYIPTEKHLAIYSCFPQNLVSGMPKVACTNL